MSKHSFANRIVPRGEWVLVRKLEQGPVKGPRVLVAEKNEGGAIEVSEGPTRKHQGIVVAVGPGDYQHGALVPISDIAPGMTVVFADKTCFQVPDFPEMKEEGLFFVPASMIICLVRPQGMPRSLQA